jgi:hypothetical protein
LPRADGPKDDWIVRVILQESEQEDWYSVTSTVKVNEHLCSFSRTLSMTAMPVRCWLVNSSEVDDCDDNPHEFGDGIPDIGTMNCLENTIPAQFGIDIPNTELIG